MFKKENQKQQANLIVKFITKLLKNKEKGHHNPLFIGNEIFK